MPSKYGFNSPEERVRIQAERDAAATEKNHQRQVAVGEEIEKIDAAIRAVTADFSAVNRISIEVKQSTAYPWLPKWTLTAPQSYSTPISGLIATLFLEYLENAYHSYPNKGLFIEIAFKRDLSNEDTVLFCKAVIKETGLDPHLVRTDAPPRPWR